MGYKNCRTPAEIMAQSVIPPLRRRLLAEGIGSAMLFATVIGSGIVAERLAGGNIAVALLGNTIATGAMLFVLITMLGPISGAHFNPVVSAVAAWLRPELARRRCVWYGTTPVWHLRRVDRASHVRGANPANCNTRKDRNQPMDWRDRCHVRAHSNHPWNSSIQA